MSFSITASAAGKQGVNDLDGNGFIADAAGLRVLMLFQQQEHALLL